MNKLNATYLTHAGAAEEALAKQEGREVEIAKIVIGLGKLAGNLDPRDQTALLMPHVEVAAFTHTGKVAGEFKVDAAELPIPDTAYNYWEIGTVTTTGVLYTYTRSLGDFVPGKDDLVSKVTRPRLYFKTQSSDVITITEDKTQQYVTKHDFDAHVQTYDAFVVATNDAIDQLERKDNAATNSDIDNGRSTEKHIKLPQLWRAIAKRITAAFNNRTIATTGALQGGGTLGANRTLSIKDATTGQKGAVQLEDSVTSTSTTKAATPNSVRIANNRAIDAENNAKAHADNRVSLLLGNAPTAALDTIKELGDALQESDSDIAAINAVIGTKATKKELSDKSQELREEVAGNYLPKRNGELESELKMPDFNVINRRFVMLENVRKQYILLCHNAKKNDVNGVIRIDRTTGSYQASVLNVVVTSSAYEMRGGAMTSLQVTESNEVYRLVKLIHNSISYVAIEYTGSLFPSNICTFTGRLLSTAGDHINVVPDSAVSDVTEFGNNSKFNINADKMTVNEHLVFNENNFPSSHSYKEKNKDKYASEFALNLLYNAIKDNVKYSLLTSSNTTEMKKSLSANNRFLISNPFGNDVPVQLIVELFIDGEWADPGWVWASTSPFSEGTRVNYIEGQGIAIQTGRRSVSGASNATGGGHSNGKVLTSVEAGLWRIHVSRIGLLL